MSEVRDAGYDDVEALGEMYDHVPLYQARPDVGFYVEEALDTDGPVLELGSGTGRVLFPIAQRGRRITGVDNSARMLARCRERLAAESAEVRSKIKLVKSDMRELDLGGERFSIVLIPFRPFQHLISASDQIAALQGIHRHLERGGRLVFDVFNPNIRYLIDDRTEEREDTPEVQLPDGRSFREADGSERRIVHGFLMRWFWRYELEHMLARCGFKTKAVFGDFNRSPLTDASPEMIFIAERI